MLTSLVVALVALTSMLCLAMLSCVLLKRSNRQRTLIEKAQESVNNESESRRQLKAEFVEWATQHSSAVYASLSEGKTSDELRLVKLQMSLEERMMASESRVMASESRSTEALRAAGQVAREAETKALIAESRRSPHCYALDGYAASDLSTAGTFPIQHYECERLLDVVASSPGRVSQKSADMSSATRKVLAEEAASRRAQGQGVPDLGAEDTSVPSWMSPPRAPMVSARPTHPCHAIAMPSLKTPPRATEVVNRLTSKRMRSVIGELHVQEHDGTAQRPMRSQLLEAAVETAVEKNASAIEAYHAGILASPKAYGCSSPQAPPALSAYSDSPTSPQSYYSASSEYSSPALSKRYRLPTCAHQTTRLSPVQHRSSSPRAAMRAQITRGSRAVLSAHGGRTSGVQGV